MNARNPPLYASEAAMCAQFLADIGPQWTGYPETGGFDILLVRNRDGFQIGVEAKQSLNPEVLHQILEDRGVYYATRPGPDCRAVLVPRNKVVHPISKFCAYAGITVISIGPKDNRASAFDPDLPEGRTDSLAEYRDEFWFELCPTVRITLPEYVPDVAAGAAAPLQLTPWKIAAIKVSVILDIRGYVTRADFKDLRIDIRRWIARKTGWLRPGPQGFTRGLMPDFQKQHPRVYSEIMADSKKWMPKANGVMERLL